MDIQNQSGSLAQLDAFQQASELIASPVQKVQANDSSDSTLNSTEDTLTISAEARARLAAEQSTENSAQLTGSGGANGDRPK